VPIETGYSAARLRHLALFYRGPDQYRDAVTCFVRDGLSTGERVLVAVPGYRLFGLRTALGSLTSQIRDRLHFADMGTLGRNPCRIIPAVQEFIAAGNQPVRFVGEPIWAGRSAAEIIESTRHEALINLAFAGTDIRILCPYDAAHLPDSVLADACQTHPSLTGWRIRRAGAAFLGPGSVPERCTKPLSPPPRGAQTLRYRMDLRSVRDFASALARAARLPAGRASNLILAVNEVAANTLRHSGGDGVIRGWQTPGELICELSDGGHITDPLAGRRLPEPEQAGGHGLWLVNRSVDLTEIRSGAHGTVIRLHVSLPAGPSRPERSADYRLGYGRDDRGSVDGHLIGWPS
jgi:anti-sigma regulatory factor (Ser/Thr protein kinase)